jgi:hypothetical protein
MIQQCNAQLQYLLLNPAYELDLFVGFVIFIYLIYGLVLFPLLEFLYNGLYVLYGNLLSACQLVCWLLVDIFILCSEYITQQLLLYSCITLDGGNVYPTVKWLLGLNICFFAICLKQCCLAYHLLYCCKLCVLNHLIKCLTQYL